MQPLTRPWRLKVMKFCPEHPKVRPKTKIYTPERDDEHPCPFHMGVPPGQELSITVIILMDKVKDNIFNLLDILVSTCIGFITRNF